MKEVRFELLVEIAKRYYSPKREVIIVNLLNAGRFEDAEYIRDLSRKDFILGMFEAILAEDDYVFDFEKEDAA